MAVYYVFNLHYNLHVKPSLLSLQAICRQLEETTMLVVRSNWPYVPKCFEKLSNSTQSAGDKYSLQCGLMNFIFLFNHGKFIFQNLPLWQISYLRRRMSMHLVKTNTVEHQAVKTNRRNHNAVINNNRVTLY